MKKGNPSHSGSDVNLYSPSAWRYCATSLAVLFSIAVIWNVSTIGASALNVSVAAKQNSVNAADRALKYSPRSADAYLARGNVHLQLGDSEKAASDLQAAADLRGKDYFVWMQLGRALEQLGETDRALQAYSKSAETAPFYSGPRWHLGLLLLRSGKRDEGWAEIQKAFRSDPALLMNALEMAWKETRGNADEMRATLSLQDGYEKLILGFFLLDRGSTIDAASFMCDSDVLPPASRQVLVDRLIAEERYHMAYMIDTRSCDVENSAGFGQMKNGGFEEDMPIGKTGFDWHLGTSQKNVSVTRDAMAATGNYSLKMTFDGYTDQKMIGQLIPIEPNSRYRLSYSLRSKQIVTDSFPLVAVKSGSGAAGKVLAASEAIRGDADDWTDQSLEFTSDDSTEAVSVSLDRSTCRYKSCPMFGTLWTDNWDLQKLK